MTSPGLVEVTQGLRFTVTPAPDAELVVEGFGEDVLTTLEVEATVSAVSRHPEVRDLMRRIQRSLGEGGAVIEGRDIGSVVFPDAAVKIFLVAPTPDRVERRADQRAAGEGDIAASLRERDRDDARTNPFVPARDAVVLDTGRTRGRRNPRTRARARACARSVAHGRGLPVSDGLRPTDRVPVVAVIGRQNVGKSTLVNRVIGRRVAIAHDTPGVTRDRLELDASWRGRRFRLVDTAGFLRRASGVEALAGHQAERGPWPTRT